MTPPPARRAGQAQGGGPRPPAGRPNGLLSRARDLGENILRATGMAPRMPKAGDWRASDFSDDELEAWDRDESVPFDMPDDPDAPRERPRDAGRPGDGRRPPPRGPRAGDGRRSLDDRMGWDDDEAGWETGTWDTGWATGFGPRAGVEDWSSGPMGTMEALIAPNPDLNRRDRIRMLRARRPAAATLLLFLALGIVLSAIAPLIPLIRLGYDTADLAYRASALQSMLAGGSSALFNTSKLKDAQGHLDGIQRDLYEINGAMNIIGGPLGKVSATMRDYRLLIRIGYDLTAAGDEGLSVAQTLLTPLQGGALSADASTPGITADDIQRARAVLADAELRVLDAVAAYNQLDQSALPAQLKPGTKYGQLLALLPIAPNAIVEMKSLLDAAPALLGIGAPAYYLVTAMDRTELRPGGGFQGNFGLLKLAGGKQSKDFPLSLADTYNFDGSYFKHFTQSGCNKDNFSDGPQPPDYFWWWPYGNLACIYGWGLRDSNLLPDFPSNARTAIQIVRSLPGAVPDDAPIQGVVSFTPVLIADLLAATGNLEVPDFKVTVTPDNLEQTIHDMQLGGAGPTGVPRKEFTHQLSKLLLDRLKTLPKDQLKNVLAIVEKAIKHKDLQIYLSDPRAELILQQLDLGSEISRGGRDGFFVVDTNDGGNKANLYVTEHQTDFVTLLPDGGALHRLQIAVTYDKKGTVYEGTTGFAEYSDMQRTYLPGDATIMGYSGFNPNAFNPGGCSGGGYYSLITRCETAHMSQPSTASDVPGRSMVMGPLLVMCGDATSLYALETRLDYPVCASKPQKHTQTVYVEWYTPNAFTRGADGHGTYSMLVEKQPGTNIYRGGQETSLVTLTVYVSAAALTGSGALPGDTADTIVTNDDMHPSGIQARDTAYAKLIAAAGVKKAFDGPLLNNQPVDFAF